MSARAFSQRLESKLQCTHGHAPAETALQAQPGFAGIDSRGHERTQLKRPCLRSYPESVAHDCRSRRQDRHLSGARQRSDPISYLRSHAVGVTLTAFSQSFVLDLKK